MIAIDYRNITWDHLQATVQGKRLEVLSAWKQHGPCTTRELAAKADMDLLAVRPRTTELLQLGLLKEVEGEGQGHEGVYRALSDDEAMTEFSKRVAEARGDGQLQMAL
jgi:predicted transcriptional regulator